MAVGPSLVEFLVGESLASQAELRVRVLHHCLTNDNLPICCWVAVLGVVARERSAEDVILHVVGKFKADTTVIKWATDAASDVSLPLVTRLRLHIHLHGNTSIPTGLHAETATAVLAGAAIPSEVLPLLDVAALWKEALENDIHLTAAVLVGHLPASCLQKTSETISFLQRGLVHAKRGQRRACIEVLRAIFGVSEAAFLSLLSEQQPLHLLSAVEDPPVEFHDVAATLALRYGDTRVQDVILSRLSISDDAILSELAQAACRYIGGARPPNWVADWQRKAGRALCRQGLDAVEALLANPFPQGSIAVLLDTWQEDLDSSALALPSPGMLRTLRRHAPDTSTRYAQNICSSRNGQTLDHDLVLELLLCQRSDDLVNLASTACVGAAKLCPRKDLEHLANVVPDAVIEALLSGDASGALRAVSVFPEIIIASTVEGFTLQLDNVTKRPTYGPILWAAAFDACVDDPSLAKYYPPCDPAYSCVRCKLIDLGPLAAAHAAVTDEATMCKWSEQTLSRYEKIEWLHAAQRLLQDCPSSFTHKAKSIAVAWANSALKDDALVRAALVVLVAAGGGADSLEFVWASVKSCSVATEAAQLLGVQEVPAALLERVLYSSTLSSALAALHIKSADRSVSMLALLAVRAVAHSGSFASSGHPAIQLCSALLKWPGDICIAFLHQLLHVELPLLHPEGSAKGEPHYRHMRLWLCIGTIVQQHKTLAEEVAVAAETFLRETMLLPTRVLVQNVWARAAWASPVVLQRLVKLLQEPSLTESFSARCIAVAAQLLLHPEHDDSIALEEADEFRPLLTALVGWSASYVQNPRVLATLALFHAIKRGLLQTPGWYLTALHNSVEQGSAFKKLREHIHMDRWVSDAWKLLQHPDTKCPLDVSVSHAQKHVSQDFWTAPDHAVTSDVYQRRPAAALACDSASLIIVGSFLDNLPNMAGLVRTSEALLGGCAEVTLHSTKVLSDPCFLKMSVAAERAGHIIEVPQGPRLIAYIREKRAEGFAVAALEQTSKSVTVSLATQLPERLVLLIGNEQQGLPAWLVQSALVDIFLELPLLGQTGSLNAHVTAAMVLWHYRMQH